MAIIKHTTQYNESTRKWEQTSAREAYVGRVVKVFMRDYRAMSDVYTLATFATVMNDDGTFSDVLVNANFELDVSGDHAAADASPETLTAWHAHLARLEKEAEQRAEAQRVLAEEQERNRPVKGKRMEVFKGRKVPIGTQGTVAYVSWNGRVLLKPDHCWEDRAADGTWVSAANLRAR
jgi:hypothetical protein